MLIQQLVNGLSVGSVYALAAVGFTMIYGVLGISNFAHGELTMVGAFAAFFLVSLLKLSAVPAIILGTAASMAMAVVTERVAYKPLRERNAPTLYYFISACGVSTFLMNLFTVVFGGTFRSFPELFRINNIALGSISIGFLDLLTFLVTVISVVGLESFLNFTRTGKGIRAISYDIKTASLMGINVDRLCIYTFLIAGALAGLSGILRGMRYTVHPNMGLIVLKAFIVAIFGGLGSIPGAFVGAMVLGITETLVAGFVSTTYRDVFAFVLLIAVLLVRPSGLLGKPVDEKA